MRRSSRRDISPEPKALLDNGMRRMSSGKGMRTTLRTPSVEAAFFADLDRYFPGWREVAPPEPQPAPAAAAPQPTASTQLSLEEGTP